MGYASTIPANVRRAVSIYVRWRRLIGALTALLAGTAAAAAIAVAFMVVDRYTQWPQAVRIGGPWIALTALAAGVLAALVALLRHHSPFRALVRLDRAFPQHQDRWSSSLDLAEQVAAGRNAGHRPSLDRLFADTDALPARGARSIVPRGRLWAALAGFILAGALVAFVRVSPAFDLPLLWQRFIHPRADLPRDSDTRIVLTEVNGEPFTGTMPPALPEGAPLSLRVELRRKPGLFAFGQHEQVIDSAEQLPPRLERQIPGAIRRTEFARAGAAWIFTQPRLEEPLEFRIRADDGLTQVLRADMLPRIKLAGVDTSARLPRYTRAQDQPMAPLQGNRISVLADSTLSFRATFDQPFKSVTATFEAMKPDSETGPPTEAERLGNAAPKDATHESASRPLRVQRWAETAALFSLRLDASGILRLRAVGEDGLASEEWVCAIEAVPDAPPRIVISGLEPETTIVKGETVSFQYRAEDDLAVTDVMMDWSVAGGIHQGNLGGDEHLQSKNFGQKVVVGEELIQRMDYAFYGTEPFQFFLTVVDSKGQESRTELFKIYTASDDYATRFDRGMELLDNAGAYQATLSQQIAGIAAQLNILATAAGDAKKWDKKLDVQFENFLQSAQRYDDSWFFTKRLALRYGGVPDRLERALQLILAATDTMATRADYVSLALSMKTTNDLPGVIAKIRALLEAQHPTLEAWAKAADGEKARFFPEHLLNLARAAAARLAILIQTSQPPEAVKANLQFNREQIDAWVSAAEPLTKRNPEFAPLIDALKAAREESTVDAMLTAVRPMMMIGAFRPIIEKLSARDLPPDEALTALSEAMARTSPGVADAEECFPTMIARMVSAAGQNDLLRPAETIELAQPWMAGSVTPQWRPASTSAADVLIMAHQVWEALRIYRADQLARRFERNPQEGVDHEIALRERALSTKEALPRVSKGELDDDARERLQGVLTRLSVPGAGLDVAVLNDLTAVIRGLGVKPLLDLGKTASPAAQRLVAAMRKTATQYDRHADAVAKLSTRLTAEADMVMPERLLLQNEAARLQVRTEGLESLYRAVKLAVIESRLAPSGSNVPWSYFEPFHGVQLGISLAASEAGEGVLGRHIETFDSRAKAGPADTYMTAATNARHVATQLRSSAQLLETAMEGKPVSFDYARLMKDARADGLLGALREEYELVQAYAGPNSAGALADAEGKLSKSALARIVRGEETLVLLTDAMEQLKAATGRKPPEVIAALKLIQKALPSEPGAPPLAELAPALTEASTTQPTEPVANIPALQRRIAAVTDAVASLTESFRDQARLPVISMTAQQNRRFTTRDLPNVWVMQGVIDSFDRRWLYTMRDLELSLTRTMLEAARAKQRPDPATPWRADATDLKLQYGRMVEWRARNSANDRRKNQGISLLAVDNGPSLKLPEHIADEFMRTRNLQSPEEFRPRIEGYYEELYRDLSK